MPPTITSEQAPGFGVFMLEAVIGGRVASIKKDTEVKNNFGIEGRGARV